MIVVEDQIHKALEFLRDSAEALGKAKERSVKADHMVKHTEALRYKASEEKTADSRRADARTSQEWVDAVLEDAIAAGEYQKLLGLRQAAELTIEAWRTEQSNYRALKHL